MLEELMTWHGSFLQYLVDLQKHPNTIIAHKLADLGQKQWQTERRLKKQETEKQLKMGAHLAKLRDSNKRTFDDMSATEQQTLEEFETDIIHKQLEKLRIQKP